MVDRRHYSLFLLRSSRLKLTLTIHPHHLIRSHVFVDSPSWVVASCLTLSGSLMHLVHKSASSKKNKHDRQRQNVTECNRLRINCSATGQVAQSTSDQEIFGLPDSLVPLFIFHTIAYFVFVGKNVTLFLFSVVTSYFVLVLFSL